MKLIIIYIIIMIYIGICVSAQAQVPMSDSMRNRVIVRSDQFSTIQQIVDDHASHGYRVSSVSYHSGIKDLHAKGRMELEFDAVTSPTKYEYRVLTTELTASELEKEMNNVGMKGFRLLKQTPIPIELGFLRARDMFVAMMEKSADSSARYQYRIVAYRHYPSVKQRIKQGSMEGFVKICDTQFGPVTYLVMEKEIK